jgi:hypothetical protein
VSAAGSWPLKSSYSSMDSLKIISTQWFNRRAWEHSHHGMRRKIKIMLGRGNKVVFRVVLEVKPR